jgi:dephospho-CoA kinase
LLLVGLTGGIGSGKSTVARMLERLGAVLIDADDLARRAIEKGTPGYELALREFGRGILTRSREIDRERLASLIFADPDARHRLEAIVHPEVARMMAELVDPYRTTDHIVVYIVPLLVENSLQDTFDVVVTVSAGEDIRVSRLTGGRGMSDDAVRSRMGTQTSDAEKEEVADFVIRNDGDLSDLQSKVKELWARISSSR